MQDWDRDWDWDSVDLRQICYHYWLIPGRRTLGGKQVLIICF